MKRKPARCWPRRKKRVWSADLVFRPVQEWKDGVESGEILEIFACGTAAIVTPIGELRWEGGSARSTAGESGGEVTRGIRARLLDIQQGRAEDTYGWMLRLL